MSNFMERAALWGALSLGVSMAGAQTLPDAGIELRRQDEQQQRLRQRQETTPEVRLSEPVPALPAQLPPDEPGCRVIRSVRFEPAQARWLNAALAGPAGDDAPAGRCLGARGIAIVLNRVNNALIAQGQITSHAKAAPQSLVDGDLLLHVEQGRVGRILRTDDEGRMAPWPAPTVVATHAGQVLDLRDLEQTLENLRRNPGFDADIQIAPGELAGQSDLLIRPLPGKPWHVDLAMDDSGSRSTGQWQGNATLSWLDPLGLSDLLYLSVGRDLGGHDAGPRGTRSTLLHHSVPAGHWLWSATVSQHTYQQDVAGPFQHYRYSGQSGQGEVQLSRVVHRSAFGKTTVGLKAFTRQSRNFIDDAEVQVQHRRTGGWELEARHSHRFDSGASMQGQFMFRRGTGAFKALPAPEEAFGEGSSRMQLAQGSFSWQVPLHAGQGDGPFDGAWQYSGQWRAQWHGTPLTPQDRLCLGGRYTVHGFDGDQNLCGERGQLLRQELATPWHSGSGHAMQGYLAFDAGRVRGPSAPRRAQLAGAAIGWRWAGHAFQVDAFVGHALHNPAGLPTLPLTAGISLNASF